MAIAEIHSATKGKITIGFRKPQLLSIKFDQTYTKVNAFNLGLLAKMVYWENETHIRDFLFPGKMGLSHPVGLFDCGNLSTSFLGQVDEDFSELKKSYAFINEESTDTQFIRYWTKDSLVIAFRGTAGKTDIRIDLTSTLVPFTEGKGRIHGGFASAFKSVAEEIDIAVEKAPGRNVIVTGHSLGGALATVAAAYIRHKYQRKVMAYTFGCPRVGDAEFAHHFTAVEPFIHFRCIHNTDLVPMVPPPYANLRLSMLICGPTWISAFVDPFGKPFTHHGKPVWLRRLPGNLYSVDDDKRSPGWHKVDKGSPIQESRPKWDAYLGHRLFSVQEHFMENYVAILGSDLRCTVRAYLENSSAGPLKNARASAAYLESDLKLLRAERDRLIMANPALADATAIYGQTRPDQLSPHERFDLLNRIIGDKSLELSMEQGRVARMAAPGFASGLLRMIGGGALTPALKRELEYHAEHIKY